MKSLIEFIPIPGVVSDINSSGWGDKIDPTPTHTTISKMYRLSLMKIEKYSTSKLLRLLFSLKRSTVKSAKNKCLIHA